METFFAIIKSIDTEKININPTVIYNEGWMTRLLVYESIQEKIKLKDLDFGKISNWTSEALISSPFIRADSHREGYTHADIALGDFLVNYADQGKIKILKSATVFGIIEAKMGSNLSQGTKHFKDYNQASRNLACIAYNTCECDCEIFFYVIAPEKKLIEHEIEKQIKLHTMIDQIVNRFKEYSDNFKKDQKMELVISKAKQCKVQSISYVEWINKIKIKKSRYILEDFYEKTKYWNRII